VGDFKKAIANISCYDSKIFGEWGG
jgi:hypothetical protein